MDQAARVYIGFGKVVKFMADYHFMSLAENDAGGGKRPGNELDLTIILAVNKYFSVQRAKGGIRAPMLTRLRRRGTR